MVLLLLAVVQLGVYYHLRAVALTAAGHGVDQVRVIHGTPQAGMAAATQFLDQNADALTDRIVTAHRSETSSSVTVRGTVVSVMPGVVLTVDVTARSPTERLTP